MQHEMNDKITYFRLLVRLPNDPIDRSLIINGSCVYNDFIVGVCIWEFLAKHEHVLEKEV